jgi:hypothetical protein
LSFAAQEVTAMRGIPKAIMPKRINQKSKQKQTQFLNLQELSACQSKQKQKLLFRTILFFLLLTTSVKIPGGLYE